MSLSPLTPIQVMELDEELQAIIHRHPEAEALYKHDPLFRRLVGEIKQARRHKREMSIPFLATIMYQICNEAYLYRQAGEKMMSSQTQRNTQIVIAESDGPKAL